MAKVYVNIGSNLGDRYDFIEKAVEEIKNRFGVCRESNCVESVPWGFDSTNLFVNKGLMFESQLEPVEILEELQQIEKKLSKVSHRDVEGEYKDREIDIDIMAIGNLVIESDLLTLPHRFLEKRNFFLKPLQELDPLWRHPLTGLTAGEMINELLRKEN